MVVATILRKLLAHMQNPLINRDGYGFQNRYPYRSYGKLPGSGHDLRACSTCDAQTQGCRPVIEDFGFLNVRFGDAVGNTDAVRVPPDGLHARHPEPEPFGGRSCRGDALRFDHGNARQLGAQGGRVGQRVERQGGAEGAQLHLGLEEQYRALGDLDRRGLDR